MSIATLSIACTLGACEEVVPSNAGGPAAPPANAAFLEPEIDPEAVAASITSVKEADARLAAAGHWKETWIPEPGWFGTVERVEPKDGATHAWFTYAGHPLFGSFWVAVEFPGNTRELSPARSVTFTGRIQKVEVLNPGGMPEIRIIVRDGKVLTLDGQ